MMPLNREKSKSRVPLEPYGAIEIGKSDIQVLKGNKEKASEACQVNAFG
jgi:hypothetical protein